MTTGTDYEVIVFRAINVELLQRDTDYYWTEEAAIRRLEESRRGAGHCVNVDPAGRFEVQWVLIKPELSE